MDRLPFSLPEFTRIVWTSERARDTWEPRLKAIATVWPIIERLTVTAGLRPGVLQSITPDQLITFQQWCIDHEEEYVILAQEGMSPVYGNAAKPYDPSQPWSYRVYAGYKPKDFIQSWVHGNNREIGLSLGYPVCCTEFFEKHWRNDGWRDLTYPMTNFKSGIVSGSLVCNILLRHIGARAVFHLPCAFNCDETEQLGGQILAYMGQAGYEQEMAWLTEILDWPVRWSSLHGVAMITTPCLKVITSTDALPEVVTIDRPSNLYPTEGASGKYFPFKETRKLVQIVKDDWTDNGFSSRASMQAAHDLILKATEKLTLSKGDVLDLGCGNGLLLEKLCKQYPFLSPIGVEVDAKRVTKARMRHSGGIYQSNVLDIDVYLGSYQLILLSLNRLRELDEITAFMFLKHLREHAQYLLIYSYEPWHAPMDRIISESFEQLGDILNSAAEVRTFKPRG